MPPADAPETYLVYGLILRSSVPIDGLERVSAAEPSLSVDCHVERGAVEPLGAGATVLATDPLDDDDEPSVHVERSADGETFVFVYRDDTRFRVEERGGRITTQWAAPATVEDMATYLLGPVLAFVLRLRGTLALHASAAEVNGCALLLCGVAGAGKSTAGAALVASGAKAISDDVAVVAWRSGRPHVEPGYPRLRLWSDSAAALYGHAEALPRLTPTWEKRYLDARGSFAAEAVPIGAIAVLRARTPAPPAVRRLDGHQAAMSLLVRTSALHLLDSVARAAELARIAELLAAVPVFEVTLRDDLRATAEAVATLRELLR